MICFCLAGVKVALHFGFFAVLFLIVELTGSDWALWGVFCCLVHELGHAAAYALCGARPRELHFEAGGSTRWTGRRSSTTGWIWQ